MRLALAILLFFAGILFGKVKFYHLMWLSFAGGTGVILAAIVMSVRNKRRFFFECSGGAALQLAAYFSLSDSSATRSDAYLAYLLLTQWIAYGVLAAILIPTYRYAFYKTGARPPFHLLKVMTMVLIVSNAIIMASFYL